MDAKIALLVVFGCEYSSDVIPAAKTVSAKTAKSSNRKQKDLIVALTLMLPASSANSESRAYCCDIILEYCEAWITPLAICFERVARGEYLHL